MGVSRSSYVNTAATSHGTAGTYSGLTVGTVAFAGGGDGSAVSRSVAAEPGATDHK